MEDEREVILRELMKEHPILEMVSFNELDLQEKLKENAFQVIKYQDLYNREKMAYEKLEELMEVLAGECYDHYRFDEDRGLTKTEIEKYYLPKDKKVKQMKGILRKQKVKVEFFQMCMSGLKQMAWNMKEFGQNERRGI